MAYGAHAAREGDARAARDNVRVWDGSSSGHYEVWYLTASHAASGMGFWIRYTLEAPLPGHGEAYAQLWFAAFDRTGGSFALNRRVPIAQHRAIGEPFAVHVNAASLRHDGCHGALRGDGHAVSWDLQWLPGGSTYRQLPAFIYATPFADTRVVTPNLDVPLRGEIEIDGRTLVFDGDPGGQTHVWGRKHAHAWAWGHCNAFEGRRGVALEALTAQLKRRGVVLPPLTVLGLELDGERLRFAELRHTLLNRGEFGTARYRFRGVSREAKIEGEFTCKPDDMILAQYEDPDGEASYCHNSCVADLRLGVWRRGRLGRYRHQMDLRANGTAHFEVAGRQADPAVRRRHVTIT